MDREDTLAVKPRESGLCSYLFDLAWAVKAA